MRGYLHVTLPDSPGQRDGAGGGASVGATQHHAGVRVDALRRADEYGGRLPRAHVDLLRGVRGRAVTCTAGRPHHGQHHGRPA